MKFVGCVDDTLFFVLVPCDQAVLCSSVVCFLCSISGCLVYLQQPPEVEEALFHLCWMYLVPVS